MIQLQLSHTLPQLQLRRKLKLGTFGLTRHSLASDLFRTHLHPHLHLPVLPGSKAQPRHSSLLFPNPTILTASTVSNINNSNCSQLVKLDHSLLSNQPVVLMFQEALQRLFHLVLQFHSKPMLQKGLLVQVSCQFMTEVLGNYRTMSKLMPPMIQPSLVKTRALL